MTVVSVIEHRGFLHDDAGGVSVSDDSLTYFNFAGCLTPSNQNMQEALLTKKKTGFIFMRLCLSKWERNWQQ